MEYEYLEYNELSCQENLTNEAAPIFALPAEVSRFEDLLKTRLTPAVCAKTKDIVQNVIMAALDAGGIQLSKPEVLVDAAFNDPEITAEILEMADGFIGENVQ